MTLQLPLFTPDSGHSQDATANRGGGREATLNPSPSPATLSIIRRELVLAVGDSGRSWFSVSGIQAFTGLRRDVIVTALGSVPGHRIFRRRYSDGVMQFAVAVEEVRLEDWIAA